jgi:hypothetical protein
MHRLAPASNLIFEQLVCHDWTFIFSLILFSVIDLDKDYNGFKPLLLVK